MGKLGGVWRPATDPGSNFCDEWGCTSLRGTPTEHSRAVEHGGSWFWIGYLVFYEGETIVAIYRLNTG